MTTHAYKAYILLPKNIILIFPKDFQVFVENVDVSLLPLPALLRRWQPFQFQIPFQLSSEGQAENMEVFFHRIRPQILVCTDTCRIFIFQWMINFSGSLTWEFRCWCRFPNICTRLSLHSCTQAGLRYRTCLHRLFEIYLWWESYCTKLFQNCTETFLTHGFFYPKLKKSDIQLITCGQAVAKSFSSSKFICLWLKRIFSKKIECGWMVTFMAK